MNPHHAALISDEDRKIIEKGIRCEALFNTPVFAEVVNALSEEYANGIINTDIQEVKKRESLYMLHRSLHELVAHIKGAISIRAETEVRLKAEEQLTLSEADNEDNF